MVKFEDPVKVKRKIKHSSKGILVRGFIPPIARDFLKLDFFKKEIKKMLKGNSGLYVLYDDNELYYVGITSKDLFLRLSQHTKDKHKNRWDKFSVFIVGRGKYLKDIETIVHLISDPPANVSKGRFKKHYQYDNKIKQMVKEASKVINDIETQTTGNRVRAKKRNHSSRSSQNTKKPRMMRIRGSSIRIDNSYEILLETAKYLFNKGFLNKSDMPINASKGRSIVNSKPKHPTGREFTNGKTCLPGVYVETNNSRERTIQLAKILLKKAGLSEKSLKIEY